MNIACVVAIGKNNVIGKGGTLPWRLPLDLKFFQKLTTGHVVIMGRKTFESIGRPLPNRTNIVVTRQEIELPGCIIAHSVDEACNMAKKYIKHDDDEEVFVIGGAQIFEAVMERAQILYITEIDHEFEGDTYLPPILSAKWVETKRTKGVRNDANPYDYYFVTYERKK